MDSSNKPILRVKNVSKRFGSVQALDKVSFDIYPGKVHALMGENGAGKSTVAKIIAGVYSKDSGEIEFDGKNVVIEKPVDAINLGIAIVMQEFNSMPHLPVYENIYLGHPEIFKHGFLEDKTTAIEKTREMLAMFSMQDQISPNARLNDLSVAQQQIVEIIKAVSYDAKVIILDEPTASLTSKEVEILFKIVNQLKEKGVAFIIVSHRFNEIFEISDHITVFRDGQCIVSNENMSEMDEQKLVKAMVGREIKDFFGTKIPLPADFVSRPMLEIDNLSDSWGFIKNLSFTANTGEILGFSGLVGAGRTTLVRTIFGAESRNSGTVKVDGQEVEPAKPADAIKKGISLVTENRKQEGVFLDFAIRLNTAFAKTTNNDSFVLPHRAEISDCKEMIEQLAIKIGHYTDPASSLSGGNQQKVVLGKWLLTEPKVLILDEPTRGIDISAKVEIYNILHKLVAKGVCVIIVSSELPEILGICDRVLVMKDGKIVAEVKDQDINEETIMSYASFGKAITE